jgi:hypothetical protein
MYVSQKAAGSATRNTRAPFDLAKKREKISTLSALASFLVEVTVH